MFQLAQESDIDLLRPGYIPFGEPWHRENNKCAHWLIFELAQCDRGKFKGIRNPQKVARKQIF